MVSNKTTIQRTDGSRLGFWAAAGAVAAAVIASACCWLPLLLIALGVTGGAAAARFEALRPVVLPLAFILLALAFYFAYRKPRAQVSPDREGAPGSAGGAGEACGACCPPAGGAGDRRRRLMRILPWVAAAFVAAFAFFPEYAGWFLGGRSAAGVPADAVHWTLEIEGMTCEACAAHIEHALEKVPGVIDASVDFDAGRAAVAAGAVVKPEDLRRAVKEAGYDVRGILKGPAGETSKNGGESR